MRDVRRLVVGGVDVVHAGLEAGVHDVEVLVGQGEVQDDVRAERLDELDELGDVVGVDLCGLNGTLQCGGELLAPGLRAAGDHDVGEDVGRLDAFVGCDGGDAARSDDQDS